ncbi:hypothetical protein ACSQ6I_07260 [Anabaena sp. WFMT]|uniref:hypothetical protein n=1 Tax=Anabaena sp. WFMT TaxID=3449730 RepID=UPI003F2512FB
MTTLTSSKSTKPINDKHTAKFDVAIGLPLAADKALGDEYTTAYLKEVVTTGRTPF